MTAVATTHDLLPAVIANYARWPAFEDENGDEDSGCYDALLGELRSRGNLFDPRAPKYRVSSLAEYIRSEVQRSINRIRMLRRITRPLDGPRPTAAELRRLGRALAEVALTTVQAAAARELEEIDHESPELAGAIKYHCAEEACYLIGCFSGKPNGHVTTSEREYGGFRVLTQKLYEVVTGQMDADVSRACDHLMKGWRRFAPKRFVVR